MIAEGSCCGNDSGVCSENRHGYRSHDHYEPIGFQTADEILKPAMYG